REVFNEGLQLPAVRYRRGVKPNRDLERIIAANSRTPELVLGGIRGHLCSDRLRARRLIALVDPHSEDTILACLAHLTAATEQRMRTASTTWRDARFGAELCFDDEDM